MSELDIRAQDTNLIWSNNPMLVQLLGLSPLLAVSKTLSYGIGLGIATLFVCVLSCLTVSILRRFIASEWRLLSFMVILASYASLVEVLLQIYLYPLSLRLGIYIPLICCNAAILLRMDSVAYTSAWQTSIVDAIKTGLGMCIALVLFSACREVLISGSISQDWHILSPSSTAPISAARSGADLFRFADTQAGAFILLGCLLALINFLSALKPETGQSRESTVAPAKRARVTGRLTKDDTKD